MVLNRNSRLCAAALLVGILVGCGGDAPRSKSPISSPPASHKPGVVLLRYMVRSGSTEQRELGFLQTLESEYPEVNILTSSIYAGTTPESTKQATIDLLKFYGDAVQGIFAVCEANTDGVLRALEEAGKSSKVKVVGFDPNPASVAALGDGKISGIVLQDPVQMGYVAVQTMLAHLAGGSVEASISTGEYLATPESMHDDTMQSMIRPKRFSGKSFEPADLKYTIAVVPKGRTHEFWEAIHEGAEQAARESGITRIVFRAPILEQDLQGQVDIFRGLVAEGVDGICVAPIDADRLVSEVQLAKDKGIPVVVFDSDLYDDGRLKVSYVATDNYQGGALAARRLAEVLGHQPRAAGAATSIEKKTAGHSAAPVR